MTAAWTFATRTWERPGVAAICLDLQDRHGQCVALLLWRLWTLAEGRPVDVEATVRAIALARDWDEAVIRPLRAVRRRLRTLQRVAEGVSPAGLGDRILAVEADAERALLYTLEAVAGAPGPVATPPLAALVDLAGAWRPPAPIDLLARLVEAL